MRDRDAASGPLARQGGEPVRTQPFSDWPVFDDEMVAVVERVLRSGKVNYWTGQECLEFEREFAAFIGTEHAIAVSNGTVAIELALQAVGIEPGDEVIIPARTFVATATAVVMRGAIPVFADIDPTSGNLTADSISAVLTSRTKAIIVVHTFGWPCEMDPIMDLARQRELKVIEDCAQAHGAMYRGRCCGSIGDIGTFSFCQDKIITTGGEGGMLTTSNPGYREIAWSFKDHGKSRDAVFNRRHDSVFKWLHETIGTNWRMTEMQGALGRIALQRMPGWIETRRRNANLLDELLEPIPGLEVSGPDKESRGSCYKYNVLVADRFLDDKWTRDEIIRCLQAEGIPCGSGLCAEIYLEKSLSDLGLAPRQRLPVARSFGHRSLMFLVHPTLGEADMRDIATATSKVMASRADGMQPAFRAA